MASYSVVYHIIAELNPKLLYILWAALVLLGRTTLPSPATTSRHLWSAVQIVPRWKAL